MRHGWMAGPTSTHACNCIGPQDGMPRCPCMMRNLRQVGGRWVETIDHGPVHEDHNYGTEKVLKEAIKAMDK